MSTLRAYGLASIRTARLPSLRDASLPNPALKILPPPPPCRVTPIAESRLKRSFSLQCALNKPQDPLQPRRQDAAPGDIPEATASKPATRKAGAKASLLSAAVAAGVRSRKGFIKGRGKRRYVDPDVETKEVIAYCAAERYNIKKVKRLLESHGYRPDPFNTGLNDEVVHFQKAYLMPRTSPEDNKDVTDFGDVFIFPSGTMVTWNVPQREALPLLNGILSRAAEGSHLDTLEEESLSYLENPAKDSSEIIGDTILLGTKAPESNSDGWEPRNPDDAASGNASSDANTILAKIAFSSGLARSPKLAVLESQLNDAFDDTRAILAKLQAGGRLPFTKKFVIRKIADILSIRAQLNLYTDLTDTVPDMLWESRYELGLERYYDEVGRALDVDDRIDALNDKIQYTQDITTVLKEQLSENHGIRLEWIIIILITIEVGFELRRLYYEYKEHNDPQSTENLLRRALMHSSNDNSSNSDL